MKNHSSKSKPITARLKVWKPLLTILNFFTRSVRTETTVINYTYQSSLNLTIKVFMRAQRFLPFLNMSSSCFMRNKQTIQIRHWFMNSWFGNLVYTSISFWLDFFPLGITYMAIWDGEFSKMLTDLKGNIRSQEKVCSLQPLCKPKKKCSWLLFNQDIIYRRSHISLFYSVFSPYT